MLINEVFAPNMKVSLDVLLPDGMTGDIEIALFPAADASPEGAMAISLMQLICLYPLISCLLI